MPDQPDQTDLPDPFAPWSNLHLATTRKRAERMRLEAMRLAREYVRLARRHHLDHEIIECDVNAIVDAWSKVTDIPRPLP
jgi:hypothetical protein